MSRFMSSLRKYLLLAPAVTAVTAILLLGTGIRSAAADPMGDKNPKNAHEAYRIRDPKVDPKMSPTERARIQRDAEIKKRKDTRKFIEGVMSGKVQAAGNKGDAK